MSQRQSIFIDRYRRGTSPRVVFWLLTFTLIALGGAGYWLGRITPSAPVPVILFRTPPPIPRVWIDHQLQQPSSIKL